MTVNAKKPAKVPLSREERTEGNGAARLSTSVKREEERADPRNLATKDAETNPESAIEPLFADLSAQDTLVALSIVSALTAHLGSVEAARLWLATASPEFGTTPLNAIATGKAKLVQALLESRWGQSPIYA